MTRTGIYDKIDGERDYQDKAGLGPTSVENFINQMEGWLTDAKQSIAESGGVSIPTMASIRKAVASGVACFEQHGVPHRVQVAA